MKKYLSLAVGATMLLGTTMGLAQTANAQAATGAASGPFADVPADHWAYQAVNTLQKAGIVIGYPDGTYGGRRAMTRYEFAVAIARLLPMVQQQIDTSQFVKNSDFTAFQNDVNDRLQQQQAALDALKALVNEFQPELQRLGEDVDAINKRLDSDEQRLAVLEAEQQRVVIHADINLIARGNVNSSDTNGDPLDLDGYRIGTPGDKSIFSNLSFYHDVLLTIQGKVSNTAQAIVEIDGGNYLNHLGSYESDLPNRNENGPTGNYTEGNQFEGAYSSMTGTGDTFSIYRAYLDVPVSLGPLSGAELKVGRFGEQFTPFTLKAVDPDSYTNLPETDSGEVSVDGLGVTAGVAGAHIAVYAGKNNTDYGTLTGGPSITQNSGPFRPGSGGYGTLGSELGVGGQGYTNYINQSAGARVTFGNPNDFTIGLTGVVASVTDGSDAYLTGDTSTTTIPVDPYNGRAYNNLAVYGADFNGTVPFLKKSGLTLNGEFANSATGYGTGFGGVNSNKGTEAWYAELGYTFGPVNVKGGYKEVYNNFAAPGYWGKVGSYVNPTNIKGPIVHADLNLTKKIALVGDGAFYQGIYNVGDQSPLGSNDKLTSYDVGLKYGLSSSYGVDLGYEWDQWNLKNDQGFLNKAGKPTEGYLTFGIGHTFNRNASLKLLYQIINYSDNGTGFDPNSDSKGGVAITQFSVKF